MKKGKILLLILALSIVVFLLYTIIENINNLNGFKNCKAILDRKSNIEIKNLEETKGIPKKILQSHKNRNMVPDYIINNIKDKNPNWEYNFYNDEETINFLQKEYGLEFVNKFNSFKKGAHKCDLFRLCWLYKYGGVYIDIDSEIIKPLDKIIENIEDFTIIQNDMRGLYFSDLIPDILGLKHRALINSFIVTNKGNKYIKKCIEDVMKITQSDLDNNYGAILYVMQHSLDKNIKYQIFERPENLFINNNRMALYDKNNKKIGYSCYKNYKDGKFKLTKQIEKEATKIK